MDQVKKKYLSHNSHAQNNIICLTNSIVIFRILHRKLEKANRAQYFRFFHPTLALDSCQTQNAISMENRLEDTETGQFWLLPIHIG